jgi:hypothetical protein
LNSNSNKVCVFAVNNKVCVVNNVQLVSQVFSPDLIVFVCSKIYIAFGLSVYIGQLLLCVKISYCRCRNTVIVLSIIIKSAEIQWTLTPVLYNYKDEILCVYVCVCGASVLAFLHIAREHKSICTKLGMLIP